jgi:hypothetical protein
MSEILNADDTFTSISEVSRFPTPESAIQSAAILDIPELDSM